MRPLPQAQVMSAVGEVRVGVEKGLPRKRPPGPHQNQALGADSDPIRVSGWGFPRPCPALEETWGTEGVNLDHDRRGGEIGTRLPACPGLCVPAYLPRVLAVPWEPRVSPRRCRINLLSVAPLSRQAGQVRAHGGLWGCLFPPIKD